MNRELKNLQIDLVLSPPHRPSRATKKNAVGGAKEVKEVKNAKPVATTSGRHSRSISKKASARPRSPKRTVAPSESIAKKTPTAARSRATSAQKKAAARSTLVDNEKKTPGGGRKSNILPGNRHDITRPTASTLAKAVEKTGRKSLRSSLGAAGAGPVKNNNNVGAKTEERQMNARRSTRIMLAGKKKEDAKSINDGKKSPSASRKSRANLKGDDKEDPKDQRDRSKKPPKGGRAPRKSSVASAKKSGEKPAGGGLRRATAGVSAAEVEKPHPPLKSAARQSSRSLAPAAKVPSTSFLDTDDGKKVQQDGAPTQAPKEKKADTAAEEPNAPTASENNDDDDYDFAAEMEETRQLGAQGRKNRTITHPNPEDED